MIPNLPRTVLQSRSANSTGCGGDLPGYFKIEGMYWQSSYRTGARNITACMQDCGKAQNCVGFSARKGWEPMQDELGARFMQERMRCTLHKGLQMQADHRAVSYTKCQVEGFECENGFQFSHAGTWRAGKQIEDLDDEPLDFCAKACRKDRACVGFTHRETKEGDTYCFHFENEANKVLPRRETGARTYSKCASAVEDSLFLQAPGSEDQQSQALVSTTES
mmetsp:Transcript_37459/g.97780  ORF Transcript_37459/g.97780 Transcript_37459/m.97780 type:complete len:221 (-) Transcript_37459:59-721(-)